MYFLYSHFKTLVNIKIVFFLVLFQMMLFFNELQAVFR